MGNKITKICEQLNINVDFLEVLIEKMGANLEDIEELECLVSECAYYETLTDEQIENISVNGTIFKTRRNHFVCLYD